MAALLIACGVCLTEKFNKKSRAKKEREAEYAANFEDLKAENAKRVRGMSTVQAAQNIDDRDSCYSRPATGTGRQGTATAEIHGSGRPEMMEAPPPGYDDVRTSAESGAGMRDGVVRERGRKLERGGRRC